MQHRLVQVLKHCKSLKELKQTHLQILVHGLQHCNFTLPNLLNLSSQLGFTDYAFRVFRNCRSPNIVTFNTVIKLCSKEKDPVDTLRVYDQMKAFGIAPNGFTFTLLLRCFEESSFKGLKYGEIVHGDVVKLGYCSSIFVQNNLLNFYAKCDREVDSSCRMFDEMPERDVVSWNTMITFYMARGEVELALRLFDSMTEKNIVTWNSVVSRLSKVGNMELACSVFQRMPKRNEVSWNSMISGYVRLGDIKSAQRVFDDMPEKTVGSWTAMVTGYTTIGDLALARNIFDQMPVKNVVSWNAMIAGYVHNHMFDQAFHMFSQMLMDGKCNPDETTLVSILSACSHLGSLEHGKWVDSYIRRNNFGGLSIPLGNALMDMFAKCGDIGNAKSVFHNMPKRCIITWTTMVSGLAVNGECREALNLFDAMCSEGVKPDDVVFIAVLSACTHGGFVEDGKRIFSQMVHKFGLEPRIEHYGCMVDLLGRAGKLEEAVGFVESMHLEPNAVIWATLLASCKIHGSENLLESVTRRIIKQEPSNPSYLTLISNMSASVGRWRDALTYRVTMRQQGVVKVPGCSSIQIGNKVHEFLARDTRHEEKKDIYKILYSLNRHFDAAHVGIL